MLEKKITGAPYMSPESVSRYTTNRLGLLWNGREACFIITHILYIQVTGNGIFCRVEYTSYCSDESKLLSLYLS